MKNVKEMTAALSEVFEGLKAGTVAHKEADSFANIAGKMINAHKTQLEYYTLRKETPKIPFLEQS